MPKAYFSSKSAAQRYDAGRPYHHPNSIDRIFQWLNRPIELAVDIACGTGLSTIALAERVQRVIGIDPSPDMLSLAKPGLNIDYRLGNAEQLDLPDHSVDLITVASGLHWFKHTDFFAEARRVLKPEAPLIVYENAYRGDTANDNQKLKRWYTEDYQNAFPSPPRNRFDFNDKAALREMGFEVSAMDKFENTVIYSQAEFVTYLCTQSNVIARVEMGEQSIEEVEANLHQQLQSFLSKDQVLPLVYQNYIVYFTPI